MNTPHSAPSTGDQIVAELANQAGISVDQARTVCNILKFDKLLAKIALIEEAKQNNPSILNAMGLTPTEIDEIPSALSSKNLKLSDLRFAVSKSVFPSLAPSA